MRKIKGLTFLVLNFIIYFFCKSKLTGPSYDQATEKVNDYQSKDYSNVSVLQLKAKQRNITNKTYFIVPAFN